MSDPTQPRKSENVVKLGNDKKNSAEELDPMEVSEVRDNGEDDEALKNYTNPGHEEETFPADANLFGQGRTTLSKVKPEFQD